MPPPSSKHTCLQTLYDVGEKIWDEREDVRQAFGRLESFDTWCWLISNGALEHHELQRAQLPFPDLHLRQRVAAHDLVQFVNSGVVDARRMVQCLRGAGFEFTGGRDVLDFGCGPGRILRVLARFEADVQLHGCEVDEDAVEFARRAFPFAEVRSIPHVPPSSYEAESFDAIYAYSIFTHLHEQRASLWLEELARIARPGALVVVTTAGRRLVEIFLQEDSSMLPPPDVLRARLPELEANGYAYFPFQELGYHEGPNREFFEQWDLQDYGMTFHFEPYIRGHWQAAFEVVQFLAAPDDYQDYVVLRRR